MRKPKTTTNPLKEIGAFDPGTCVMWLNLFSKEMTSLYPKVLKGNQAAAQKLRVLTVYFGKVGLQYRRSSKLFPITKEDGAPDEYVKIFKGMIDKLIL